MEEHVADGDEAQAVHEPPGDAEGNRVVGRAGRPQNCQEEDENGQIEDHSPCLHVSHKQCHIQVKDRRRPWGQ